MIEQRKIADLKPHPENAYIFGAPEDCNEWDELVISIRKFGIFEPLAILADGTILSGHVRLAIATSIGLTTVPVRVVEAFTTRRAELEFIVRCNTDRRELTKEQKALAFKRLRETPREDGGTKGHKGGGEKGRRGSPAKNHSSAGGRMDGRADEDAAKAVGLGKSEARALETVFATPGVPAELKRAVNSGKVAATPAAAAVTTQLKREGRTRAEGVKDPAALKTAATAAPRAREKSASDEAIDAHRGRVADEAKRFDSKFRELFGLYKQLDGILGSMPLKSVLGPTEHGQYHDMIRDVSLRAWREIESVDGPSEHGRQLSLIRGGKT